MFYLSGYLNIRSFSHAIFKPTWFHFDGKIPSKSRLGGVLARSWRPFEASQAVLASSWAVLAASWAVFPRLRSFWERIGRVSGRLGTVLEASRAILAALWTVFGTYCLRFTEFYPPWSLRYPVNFFLQIYKCISEYIQVSLNIRKYT